MNVNCINRTVAREYFRDLKMEPSLCRFFSIISTDGLREAFMNKKVVTWINALNYDPDSVKKYLVPGRNIRAVFRIARQYAKILEQYPPNEEGKIRQRFNYLFLVRLVEQVFELHVDMKNVDLSTKGVKILTGPWKFFAKLESGRLFIFLANIKQALHHNLGVSVGKIYDLVSRQRLILKWASNRKIGEIVSSEVNHLKAIHARAKCEGVELDWMQDLPLATFNRDDFIAYVGVRYGKDLLSLTLNNRSNKKRVSDCKSVVRGYAKTRQLRFRHGDMKPDNMVRHGDKVVLIDWAGAIALDLKEEKLKRPLSQTPLYTHPELYEKMEAILEKYKESGVTDQLKEEYIQTAEAIELFSVGVTLFCILTSQNPFHLVYHQQYGTNFPSPAFGFKKESWDILLEKNYDPAIVQVMKEMLDPNDPISAPEAIAMWEYIL